MTNSSFKYTVKASDGEGFSSTAVDNVWYNANVRKLAVEWQDDWKVYVYEGVSPAEVANALKSGSVGKAVATIKQKYGPGKNLGDSDTIRFRKVPGASLPTVTTPTRAARPARSATKEFSLQAPAQKVAAKTTREYSLQTPVKGGLDLVDGDTAFELFFNINGVEKSHVLKGRDSFDDALDDLDSFFKSAGLDVKVHKVVLTFE